MRRHLIVFVKQPRPGRAKSRLAAEIGRIDALWWYRHQTRAVLRRLGGDPRWRLVLAVTPDGAADAADWPRLPRVPQGRGDLGRRMVRALGRFDGPALVVGSDIPDLTAERVAEAFRLVGPSDVVLGPAADGGFWGIGRAARVRLRRDALDGVAWSRPDTLRQTEAALAPFRIGYAATLSDVDTAGDLVGLREHMIGNAR